MNALARVGFVVAGSLLSSAPVSVLAQTNPPASTPPAAATDDRSGSEAPIRLDRFVVTPSRFSLSDAGAGSPSTLTEAELSALPQVGEDLFRAIARLPGVTADDFTAKFWVRGAPQRQLLVRLDGADLLEPFHLKDVDGALSIIDLSAISRLDLMTGGFNADYGNRAAGVLTMESFTPRGPTRHASLGLSLTGMRAGAAGTVADSRGRWAASIRRGYPDLALKVEGREEDIFPRYWDAYGKFEFDVAPGHTVSAHALHATDRLRVFDDNAPDLRSSYTSDTLWTRWRADFSETLSAETVATYAFLTWRRDGAGRYNNRYALELRDRRSLASLDLRQDWSTALSPHTVLRAGWQATRAEADYAYSLYREDPTVINGVLVANPRRIRLTPSPSNDSLGAFVAPRFAVGPAFNVEPGLRFDRHTASGDTDVSPRFNAAYTLTPRTTLRAAWGLYTQAQGVHELPVPFGDETFQPAEQAEHRIVSLDHRFERGITVRVEAYQRLTADPRAHWLNRYDTYNVFPEAQTDRLLLSPDRAEAAGVEILAQYRGRGPLSVTMSYALSKAEETMGVTALPGLRDQRHAVYTDLTYTPNARWSFSAAWQYHTGWPITGVNFALVTLNNNSRSTVRSFGPTLGSRLPDYHRLDLRAARTFVTKHGVVKVFVDVFNAYDQANPIAYDYTTSSAGGVITVTKKPRNMLPILPTAGISWDL